jgi:hypothetical protein
MKTFLFKRESNDFKDILADKNVKKYVKTKITFYQHLIIQIEDKNVDKVNSYILLMYGDELKNFNKVIPDRTPVMYKDYWPDKPKKTLH